MTLQLATPCKDTRMVVTVYNGASSAAISSGECVRLATGSTPNIYEVDRMGSTAGTTVRLFGVCEEAIATGETGPCVIHGPAKAKAHSAITVKGPVTGQHGTSDATETGRVIAATAGAASCAGTGSYLGWAMTVGSTGAYTTVFVNTAHTNVGQ